MYTGRCVYVMCMQDIYCYAGSHNVCVYLHALWCISMFIIETHPVTSLKLFRAFDPITADTSFAECRVGMAL